ncbi:hypothetical protein FPANT_6999 [Fusarium pseudoanthophilum]|uniref:Uncharacterized protein n=1 Tax=Fusarium pseudoanthophilum TaxID=48495 RepID=A0A8H5P2A0_9HYPO|nr:hypothetical protein FPANT_6999 [Fusarium pseudoanthophilum]
MNFLKKATAQVKDLDKAKTQFKELQEGVKKVTGSASFTSSSSAASQTPSYTPTSTTASTMAATRPKSDTKLPLVARKNIRDHWDPVKPEVEAKISAILGAPWVIDFDVGLIWEHAPEASSSYATENTGKMLAEYANSTIRWIEEYAQKFGADGVAELNKLASNRTIVLEPADGIVEDRVGTDIVDGFLRIIFEKKCLASNIDLSLQRLSKAVNQAGSAGGGLSFDARASLEVYEKKIPEVKARLEKIIGVSAFTLEPNFEATYDELAAYESSGKGLREDWQKQLGTAVLDYFDNFAKGLQRAGFGEDDMLQEGFQEAVSTNKIAFAVVDALEIKGKSYNESIVKDGVLYLQVTPEKWWSNVDGIADGFVDIL